MPYSSVKLTKTKFGQTHPAMNFWFWATSGMDLWAKVDTGTDGGKVAISMVDWIWVFSQLTSKRSPRPAGLLISQYWYCYQHYRRYFFSIVMTIADTFRP